MSIVDSGLQPVLKFDRDVIFKCSIRYGLLGFMISVPVGVVAISFVGTPGPVIRTGAPFAIPFLYHILHLLSIWTFAVPIIVSTLLLLSAWLSHWSNVRASIWFSYAYRLMRMGGIFSLVPVLALTALPAAVYFCIEIALDLQRTPTAGMVLAAGFLALSVLPIIYYVVQFRIRRVIDRLTLQGADHEH